MMKRAALLVALALVVALPFALRPRHPHPTPADDTVVIITPHNQAIRYEFERGFAAWYRARTGRTVRIDWRVIGGTADIARYLEGAYAAAFENEWTERLHRPWSSEVQAAFQRPPAARGESREAEEARAAYLASNVSCGIDVFFGGDSYEFAQEAAAGRLVDAGLLRLHPEWFRNDVIPQTYGGEPFWDREGRWFGVVLSQYGIVFNRDSCARLGLEREPDRWSDLADPRLVGEVALADPTKSGSVCEAFENMIQQQMQRRLIESHTQNPTADPKALEAEAVRVGWNDGLKLIQRIGANARYFTDESQKPPIDVADGNCAAGLCIDFYGRQQQQAVWRRASAGRVGYTSPEGGSAVSADPIALLRGAPHRDAAVAFIEYTLSPEGQKLWAFRPGAPGGPEKYALRRMPIRRDFYTHEGWAAYRSDPQDAPYAAAIPFVYHPAWTGGLFREIGFVVRVMCQDAHPELAKAWRAIAVAPEPVRANALAAMQDVSRVDYEHVAGEIHRRLNSPDGAEELRLAHELGDWFRANYRRAEAIATGRE